MTVIEVFVTFVLTWWLVFFLALPWGNEPPKKSGKGHAKSAPAKPRIALKMQVTSVVTTIITLIVYIFMG